MYYVKILYVSHINIQWAWVRDILCHLHIGGVQIRKMMIIIKPITNTMARKKKQTKVVIPVAKKTLNAWQAYIKSNYGKVRSLPNNEQFRALSKMYKMDN